MNARIAKIPKLEQKIIMEFVDQIVDRLGDSLISIQLFGSRARGKTRPDSDIDILIIVKEKKRFFDETNDLVTDIELNFLDKYNIFFSSMIYSIDEYRRLSNPPTNFIYWLEKEEITLWPLKKKAA